MHICHCVNVYIFENFRGGRSPGTPFLESAPALNCENLKIQLACINSCQRVKMLTLTQNVRWLILDLNKSLKMNSSMNVSIIILNVVRSFLEYIFQP
mgnify:CR=1 FL=1